MKRAEIVRLVELQESFEIQLDEYNHALSATVTLRLSGRDADTFKRIWDKQEAESAREAKQAIREHKKQQAAQ